MIIKLMLFFLNNFHCVAYFSFYLFFLGCMTITERIEYFLGNQLQRFNHLHLGLFASSPRKAVGYFAAIPVLVYFRTLLNMSSAILARIQ